MATIIGHDATATKRKTCPHCATIFEYVPNETFEKKYGFDYTGGYEVGRFVHCPSCSKDVRVSP